MVKFADLLRLTTVHQVDEACKCTLEFSDFQPGAKNLTLPPKAAQKICQELKINPPTIFSIPWENQQKLDSYHLPLLQNAIKSEDGLQIALHDSQLAA